VYEKFGLIFFCWRSFCPLAPVNKGWGWCGLFRISKYLNNCLADRWSKSFY